MYFMQHSISPLSFSVAFNLGLSFSGCCRRQWRRRRRARWGNPRQISAPPAASWPMPTLRERSVAGSLPISIHPTSPSTRTSYQHPVLSSPSPATTHRSPLRVARQPPCSPIHSGTLLLSDLSGNALVQLLPLIAVHAGKRLFNMHDYLFLHTHILLADAWWMIPHPRVCMHILALLDYGSISASSTEHSPLLLLRLSMYACVCTHVGLCVHASCDN